MATLLKPKNIPTKQLQLRLQAGVVDELDRLKADLDAKGLTLDLNEHIERAILALVKQARSELDVTPPAAAG